MPAKPHVNVVVTSKVKSPNAGLQVTSAKLTLLSNVMAMIEPSVYIDVIGNLLLMRMMHCKKQCMSTWGESQWCSTCGWIMLKERHWGS